MRILLRYFSAGVCAALLATQLAASATAQTVTNSADPELKKKADQLTLENSVADQQLHKDLAKLTAEKQRLELENGLAAAQVHTVAGSTPACMLSWLKKKYGVPIVAYCADIGQQEDFELVKKKALDGGAEKCLMETCKKSSSTTTFTPDSGDSVYEAVYLMGISLTPLLLLAV